MNAAIRIRPMAGGDIDAVLAIASRLDSAPHWPRSVYVAALDANAAPQRLALVAEASTGEIAGFAVALLIPPEAELETIAAAPEHQRKGIGQALLTALHNELQARQIAELRLEVRESNRPALALYQAMGFQVTGQRSRYYSNPAEDAVLLYLPILPNSK